MPTDPIVRLESTIRTRAAMLELDAMGLCMLLDRVETLERRVAALEVGADLRVRPVAADGSELTDVGLTYRQLAAALEQTA